MSLFRPFFCSSAVKNFWFLKDVEMFIGRVKEFEVFSREFERFCLYVSNTFHFFRSFLGGETGFSSFFWFSGEVSLAYITV